MSVTQHKAKKRKAYLLSIGGTIVAALAASAVMRGMAAGMAPWLSFGLLTAIIAVLFWIFMPWWRGLDHMQKDAQYHSWYWGGTFGAAIALMGIFAFTGPQSPMAIGAMALFFAQVAAFTIAWIWWRVRNGAGGL